MIRTALRTKTLLYPASTTRQWNYYDVCDHTQVGTTPVWWGHAHASSTRSVHVSRTCTCKLGLEGPTARWSSITWLIPTVFNYLDHNFYYKVLKPWWKYNTLLFKSYKCNKLFAFDLNLIPVGKKKLMIFSTTPQEALVIQLSSINT